MCLGVIACWRCPPRRSIKPCLNPRPAKPTTWRLAARCSTPTPTLLITSEGLGIPGDQIDFVKEFELENNTFKQLRLVLRPAKKHKFRYEFIPIRYEKETTISRSFVFNGQRYNVSLPVLAELKWNAMRFTYEWRLRLQRTAGLSGSSST